jgi:uncharacterized Zn finger protein (UPF0148 family)
VDYKIKRSLTGSPSIHLSCPKCKDAVVFDLNDAGNILPCPVCGVVIRVPGESEKHAEAQRKKDQEAEDRQRNEARNAAAQAQRVADAKRQALVAAEIKRQSDAVEEAAFWRGTALTGMTWTLGIAGAGCLLAGMGCLLGALIMDTSTTTGDLNRVHNIGLLNTRLCLVIAGCTGVLGSCAFMLGSIVTGSAAAIINGTGRFTQRLDSRLATRTANRE